MKPALPMVLSGPSNDTHNSKRDSSKRRSTMVRDMPQTISTSELPADKVTTAPAPYVEANQHAARANTPIDLQRLSLTDSLPHQAHGILPGHESGDSQEDDQSHLSTSSTKQHSFDTKSVASVTTFAMDEKESIRPDDSASVRAIDDDDSISTAAHGMSISQEPDVIMPPYRGIISRSSGIPSNSTTRRFQTLTNPPRFGDLEAAAPMVSMRAPASPVLATTQDDQIPRTSNVTLLPDDRLLDALATPKDRLMILQLEERILHLSKQNEAESFTLPPQNAYARLLSHKLADYHGQMHCVTEDGASVRIFRTPVEVQPTTLAMLAQSIPIGSAQPPGPIAVKIMRRAGMNSRQGSAAESTAASSSAASKATSEAGHSEEGVTSPTDGTPGRDKSKMTREEREAQYKAVRERIFGDFQELAVGENISTGENSASMSRSSSSSGKRKNRRQKTPKDDSFEARSAYVPNYANQYGLNAPTSFQSSQYLDPSLQSYYDQQANFYSAQNYGTTPTQSQPGLDTNAAYPSPPYGYDQNSMYGGQDSWTGMQGSYYGHPTPQNRFGANPTAQNLPQASQYPPMSASMPAQQQQQPPLQQNWNALAFSNFQPAATGNWPGQQAYGYGQQMSVPSFNGGHFGPSPGYTSTSNGRPLFNPQTRSFVPSNDNLRTGSRNSSRKKGSPSTPAAGQGRPQTNLRSSSGIHSASLPFPTRIPDFPQGPGHDARGDSLQQKYGTPANLPKKPPPSQVPSQFEAANISLRNSSAGSVISRFNETDGQCDSA